MTQACLCLTNNDLNCKQTDNSFRTARGRVAPKTDETACCTGCTPATIISCAVFPSEKNLHLLTFKNNLL